MTDLLRPAFAGLQLVVLVHPAKGPAIGPVVAVAFAAQLVEAALKQGAVDHLVAACSRVPPQRLHGPERECVSGVSALPPMRCPDTQHSKHCAGARAGRWGRWPGARCTGCPRTHLALLTDTVDHVREQEPRGELRERAVRSHGVCADIRATPASALLVALFVRGRVLRFF